MQKNFHFISGLPRSGSTLLSAILRQNPEFHADITSPVCHMFGVNQLSLSAKTEFYPIITENIRKSMLRTIFETYYAEVCPERRVVFDTNRTWTARISALTELFPGSRIVCCVRNIPMILNSIEQIVQKNPFDTSRMFDFDPSTNIYGRVETIMGLKGLVGVALNSLKQAYYGANSDKIMIVRYESLIKNTEDVIRHIYDFIDEPYYSHDFDNVGFNSDKFDFFLGTPGLHTVRPKVSAEIKKMVIPTDLVNRFANLEFWLDQAGSGNGVAVV